MQRAFPRQASQSLAVLANIMNRLPLAPLSHDASLTSAWYLVGDVLYTCSYIPDSQAGGKKETETNFAATGNKTTC